MTFLTPFGDWTEIKPQARLERKQRLSVAMNGAKPLRIHWGVHHLRLPYVQCLGMRRNEFRHVCTLLNLEDTRHRTHAEEGNMLPARRSAKDSGRSYTIPREGCRSSIAWKKVQDYRIKHLSFFFFFVKSAALVADSKTSRTPWLVLAEHSRYL